MVFTTALRCSEANTDPGDPQKAVNKLLTAKRPREGSPSWAVHVAPARTRPPYLHQSPRVRIRKRTQQDGIQHAEHHSLGAHAQGQRQNGDSSEARRPAQKAHRETEILE
jgi:hypothetical protein